MKFRLNGKTVLFEEGEDLLHVDTQGTFLRVVEGFGELRPKIVFGEVNMSNRYYGADGKNEAHEMMRRLGYDVVEVSGIDALYKLRSK